MLQVEEVASMPADVAFARLASCLRKRNPNGLLAVTTLDTATGAFKPIFSSNSENVPPYTVEELDVFCELIAPGTQGIVCEEISRGKTLIGHVIYLAENEDQLDLQLLQYVPFLFNRKRYETFVKSLNAPIRFDVDFEQFFRDQRLLARASGATTHGAYRTWNGNSLECLFSWGFEDRISDNSDLSVVTGDVDKFDEALSKREIQQCYSLSLECPELVKAQRFQSDVKSFCAVPVEVGERVVGLLTLGSSHPYEFSKAEENSFKCISNGIGVSISNYKHYWRGVNFQDEFEDVAAGLSALEVVHQIKHNITDNAGAAYTQLDLLRSRVQKSGMSKAERNSALKSIDTASKQISKVDDDIRHIGDAVSLDRMLEFVSVKEMWDEVRDHLSQRISDLDVTVHPTAGGDRKIVMSGVIKHIFQNLMLNSLDAFENSSKPKKEIRLKQMSTGSTTGIWKLQYSDNGPGLPVALLEQQIKTASSHPLSDLDPDVPIGEYIFRPKVSTKAKGTGQGLFLSRSMAAQHLGGIKYGTNHSGGVLFDIDICFDLNRVFNASKRPIYFSDENGFKRELLDVENYLKNELKTAR